MNVRLATGAIAGLILVAAIFILKKEKEEDIPVPLIASEPTPEPTHTIKDATEVFKRAFWKRPTENDRIQHAERREWADAEGIRKWQWFIAVDPSDELKRYLETNPFRLSEPPEEMVLPAAPEWFPESSGDYEVQQSRDGQMILLTDKKNGRLFACAQGLGFAKGSENPAAPPPRNSPSSAGRLPAEPPPISERP